MRARRNGQVQRQHSASVEAVAVNAVPAAQHLRRNAEIVGDGLDRVSRMNVIAGDAAGVSRGVAQRMLAGRDGDD